MITAANPLRQNDKDKDKKKKNKIPSAPPPDLGLLDLIDMPKASNPKMQGQASNSSGILEGLLDAAMPMILQKGQELLAGKPIEDDAPDPAPLTSNPAQAIDPRTPGPIGEGFQVDNPAALAEDNQTTTNPDGLLPENPLTKIDAEIARRENKDWKGEDRDKDHNWWDVLKTAGLRGLDGLGRSNGDIWAGIGSAIGGGVEGAVDRNADEKMFNRSKLEELYGSRQRQAGVADDNLRRRTAEANAVYAEGKPERDADKEDTKRDRTLRQYETALAKMENDILKAQMRVGAKGEVLRQNGKIYILSREADKDGKVVSNKTLLTDENGNALVDVDSQRFYGGKDEKGNDIFVSGANILKEQSKEKDRTAKKEAANYKGKRMNAAQLATWIRGHNSNKKNRPMSPEQAKAFLSRAGIEFY